MRLSRIFPAFAVASLSLVGGCSNDAAVNNVVAASPPVLRDCDRLAMKVLLASYEKAGENQGRLTSFSVSSEKPARGKMKYDTNWYYPPNFKDGDLNFYYRDIALVAHYANTYYVDENGVPHVFTPSNQGNSSPDEKYVAAYYGTSDVVDGKDRREISKTNNSLTCSVWLIGEGAVNTAEYKISKDDSNIYWSQRY